MNSRRVKVVCITRCFLVLFCFVLFFTFCLVAWFLLAQISLTSYSPSLLLEVYVYSRERKLMLILKERNKLVDYHIRLKENDLSFSRAPALRLVMCTV